MSDFKTTCFEEARDLLATVLRDVGENFWARKIAAADGDWFRSLCGGMGSLSDLVICQDNGHRITPEREPLANELVSTLSSICSTTAGGRELTADLAATACGYGAPRLMVRQCRSCGYARANPRSLRTWLAAVQIRGAVHQGIAQGSATETLLELWRAPLDAEPFARLIEQVRRSGIDYTREDHGIGSCPQCGFDYLEQKWWERKGERFVADGRNS